MAVVANRPIEKAIDFPLIKEAALDVDQGAASPAVSDIPVPDIQQGLSFDFLLIWICVICWLLLVGMHVYELLAWMVG